MRAGCVGVAALSIAIITLVPFGCGKDKATEPENTAPTASFTVNPASGITATVFQFDASSSSDAEDAVSVLQVRWDWENDGTWDTNWSAAKTASHQYSSEGTETVKLEVKDTCGLSDDTTQTVTVTALPTVTVTVPNGGEDWTVGDDQDITWSSTGAVGNVKIEYSTNGGSAWTTVVASTSNTGSYSWTVPNSPSTASRVRVSSVENSSIYDISDGNFTISALPSVAVTVPNGGEDWTVGSNHNITWSSTGPVGNVKIEWSTNGGSAWTTVVASTSNTGTYPWTVPDTPSTTSGVKVSSVENPSIYDTSDGDFTILSPGPPPPDMVLVPAGTFEMGDGQAFCGSDEHQVTLTHSFYLGMYEVSNRRYCDAVQWAYDHGYVTADSSAIHDNLDGSTVLLADIVKGFSHFSFSAGVFAVDPGGDDYPMIAVSWYGAAAYCDWLSMQAGLVRAYNHGTWQCNEGDPYTAQGYRLPTDAEWEYATQCGGERDYPWGDQWPGCSRANYNCGVGWVGSTTAVGSYPLGCVVIGEGRIYDMAGNALEWCNDRHNCFLGMTPVTDPAGELSGGDRVLRGGDWGMGIGYSPRDDYLRCAARLMDDPSSAGVSSGFRYARSQR